jgi:hypothetical protein
MVLGRMYLHNRFAPGLCSAGAMILVFLFVVTAHGQQPLPVHVHFSFGTTTDVISPRFQSVRVDDIEQALSVELTRLCSESPNLGHWKFDVAAAGTPRVDISVTLDHKNWILQVRLVHVHVLDSSPDNWSRLLFRSEDVKAHGLPMDKNWIAPIRTTFANMLGENTTSGRQVLQGLQRFAPLGVSLAMIPGSATMPPGAVLPLEWGHYQDLANCQFQIRFQLQHMEITVHSRGTGGPMSFTPDAPQFDAVWVLHNQWQLGAMPPEPIANHINDLAGLSNAPVAIYLVSGQCSPIAIAN